MNRFFIALAAWLMLLTAIGFAIWSDL